MVVIEDVTQLLEAELEEAPQTAKEVAELVQSKIEKVDTSSAVIFIALFQSSELQTDQSTRPSRQSGSPVHRPLFGQRLFENGRSPDDPQTNS